MNVSALWFRLLTVPTVTYRNMALLLGVQFTQGEAGLWHHHLRHRIPDWLQGLLAAEPDLAHIQWDFLNYSNIWVFVVKFKSDNASQTKQCSCTFKFKDMKSLVWWKWLTAWYFTAVISLAVIEAIVILVLIFLRNRVRIAIALLKEGSK